jgi:plastocyanin domain-containing protein
MPTLAEAAPSPTELARTFTVPMVAPGEYEKTAIALRDVITTFEVQRVVPDVDEPLRVTDTSP